MDNLAPVIIFAYNRPDHFLNLMNSLESNDIASKSDIYVFIDGVAENSHLDSNHKVIEISERDWKFQSVKIIKRDSNLGLKENIITGISEIIDMHNKVIVLEDDLVVGKYFLNFMNHSLNKYENEDRVWHINGFNYKTFLRNSNSSFFSTHMNCWGWGTWENNWKELKNNLENKIKKEDINKFNFDGFIRNNYQQIVLNEEKKINTWAIFWYQTIFINSGLCLMPNKSLVYNAGFDGSGINTSKQEYKLQKLNNSRIIKYPTKVEESKFNKIAMKYYFFKLIVKDFINYHLKKIKN